MQPDFTNVHETKPKRCPRCEDFKSRAEFPVKRRSPDGLATYCKVCSAIYNREHRAKDERLARRKRQASRLLKTYGISFEQYEKMIWDQDGLCAICAEPHSSGQGERLHVDHDHETGAVRALLCHSCNIGLGCFKDDTDRMMRAIAYLKHHRGCKQV